MKWKKKTTKFKIQNDRVESEKVYKWDSAGKPIVDCKIKQKKSEDQSKFLSVSFKIPIAIATVICLCCTHIKSM